MLKSLRWKLLAWYVCLISLMACTFSGLTVWTIRSELQREAVQRLSEMARSLSGVIEYEVDEQFDVVLTHQHLGIYAAEYPTGPYYRIWDAQGNEVDSSNPEIPATFPHTSGTRWLDRQVEVVVDGPAGSRILIGRSFDNEYAQIRRLVLTCASVAAFTILFMLLGGWWMIGQALRPIDRISDAASRVTASNISQRICTANMESEFLRLSDAFNETLDRLEDAFRRQTHFTTDASHELRTPLSVLLAQSEHLLNADRSPSQYRGGIETIHRAATRMTSVVESLLVLARADANQAELEFEPCLLDQIVKSSFELISPIAKEKGISVDLNLQSVSVLGDPAWLGEVVVNLMTNAINYNKEAGTVTISVMQDGGLAILTVQDSGIGISDQDIDHIFDRFYRVDPSRQSSGKKGVGLGLPITQWIVKSHGGSICTESTLGEGTVFTVTLPLYANTSTGTARRPTGCGRSGTAVS